MWSQIGNGYKCSEISLVFQLKKLSWRLKSKTAIAGQPYRTGSNDTHL